MYYEEKFIDGIWYWRGTPDGEWTVKKVQMSKADEEKWRSPTGHSIANHETDKMTEHEDTSCKELESNPFYALDRMFMVAVSNPLFEIENHKNYHTINCALAQQQSVNEELLEALKLCVSCLPRHSNIYSVATARRMAAQAIARAPTEKVDVEKLTDELMKYDDLCYANRATVKETINMLINTGRLR